MTHSRMIWIALALVPASAFAHVAPSHLNVGRELGRADLARTELAQQSAPAVHRGSKVALKKKHRQAAAPASAFPSFTLDVTNAQSASDDAPAPLTRTQ